MAALKRTAARGYGHLHQRERQKWVRKVQAGLVCCARCHKLIEPGRPWDLGHTDDRKGWTGPECRRCNRVAGGRNGAKVTNAMRTQGRQTSREW
jgi:hypothetical protein